MRSKSPGRTSDLLIWKIITSIVEQAVLVGVVLWGLPRIDIHLPVWLMALMFAALPVYNVFTYRTMARIMRSEPVVGLPDMVGSTGRVVRDLSPNGMVRIGRELWAAESSDGEIDKGRGVVVVGQERLRLVVRRIDTPATDESG